MKKTNGHKAFVSPGQQDKCNNSPAVKQQYSAVCQWLNKLGDTHLSEAGERNYACRFKLPLETFQTILKEYQRSREAGKI